jgi:hypothetical protein
LCTSFYRDKLSGVFVRFSCAASMGLCVFGRFFLIHFIVLVAALWWR